MTAHIRTERPRTATPPAVPLRVPPTPLRFPDWVTETYQALDHIEYQRSTHTHQAALDTTQTAPNTSQAKSPEPTERKCRR
ncbi:hypothetical protein ACH4GZ_39120 [Streptomyces hygroscopicus]|uniref:hypothetical protein n=1 Tax=Streptomyces hygroscopicus TaxID=1912 RepID=UPI0037AC6188